MNIIEFRKMIDTMTSKKSLKRKKANKYRINDLQIIQEYNVQITIPMSAVDYFENIDFNFTVKPEFGEQYLWMTKDYVLFWRIR
jgi:hypothetical protein